MKRKTVQTKYDIPVRRAFRLHRFSFIYAVNDLWEDAYTCPINAMNCTTESANLRYGTHGYEKWWSPMILGIISLALGIICIVNAFGVVSLAMKFIGVALIYDGISDLWIVSRTAKAAKAMKQEADALDVDYKEVDD